MFKLHIRQDDPVNGSYPIRLTLKKDQQADLDAQASIKFALTEQEQNDLRWYLEEFLQHGGGTEAIVAQQVESFIQTRGEELYAKVLESNNDTRAIWYSIRNQLADLRVEVTTGIVEAASIPWELMRDPTLKSPISLRVKSFVRVQSNPNIGFVPVPAAADGRVRLLYIASRPGGESDVELRAVANRLVRDLGQDRSRFDIKALRPPTFEQLQEELVDAREAGRPYHIVHFDGHGTYEDLSNTSLAHWATSLESSDGNGHKRGYLLFEHSGEDNVRPLDGETLGKLLHDTGVPVLVLNACQSAMHEAKSSDNKGLNVHDEVRAIGSLSQAVIDQGVPAVLGMRYSVFVVTAAEYIGKLYAGLAKGRSFGQAASEGRKKLESDRKRWVGLEPHPLQDWFVPVVYEALPIELLSASQPISLADQPELDPVQNNRALLRYVPEEGFIGRDETLLALDRAFDKHRVVLLHAYAGQGKSSTAVEFARWYALTGGLGEQPLVLLSSFESYTDLDDLLNQIAQPFSQLLERQGILWSALNEPEKRRSVVIRILRSFPILWIWDNVETVAGFPEGTESQWTPEEQKELRDFLKQIKLDEASKVRILLTSRRDEQKWLGGVPHRIQMRRMRNSDAARLAKKLGEEKNLSGSEIAEWQPLLEYCAGNPLTLRVLVGQAVRARIRGKQQIEEFVEAIRTGEQEIEDTDEKEGRDKSLGASLSYGFQNAFKDDELPIIALLHLFQGTVDVDVLIMLGTNRERQLPELQGKTPDDLVNLLRRAKEVGVLTQLGTSNYFTIHPALPWFLRQLFAQYYDGKDGRSTAETALFCWVGAVGSMGSHYLRVFQDGERGVVTLLEIEENNLLHARRLARKNGWSELVISCMQGIFMLYDYHGRLAEWSRLVEEIRLEYCTADNEPVPGRDHDYMLVMGYMVWLASHYEHNIPKAIALQEKVVKICEERAAPVQALPVDAPLTELQRRQFRNFSSSLSRLGDLLAQVSNVACVETYKHAITIYKRIAEKPGEAMVEWNLGNAYKDVEEIKDFTAAEAAYRRSLALLGPNDNWGRSKCVREIGLLYFERLCDAIDNDEPQETFIKYAQMAEEHYLTALNLCPPQAWGELSAIHHRLGNLYLRGNLLNSAREHFEMMAQLEEKMGDRLSAGSARFHIALTYLHSTITEQEPAQQRANLERAKAYAEAALRDCTSYGEHAAQQVSAVEELLNEINQAIAGVGQ
jgi:hypothetical protein